jgi:hypothetical protein
MSRHARAKAAHASKSGLVPQNGARRAGCSPLRSGSVPGSFVLTGAVIKHQDKRTQENIRAAFDRASVYKSAAGLDLPVAFKVGSGMKRT